MNSMETGAFIEMFSGAQVVPLGSVKSFGVSRLARVIFEIVFPKLDWIQNNTSNGISIANSLRNTVSMMNASSVVNDFKFFDNFVQQVVDALNATALSLSYQLPSAQFMNLRQEIFLAGVNNFDLNTYLPNLNNIRKGFDNFTSIYGSNLWFPNSTRLYNASQMNVAAMFVDMPDNGFEQLE